MDVSNYKEIKYELVSEDGLSAFVINKKRILIGSGESCDLILRNNSVEGVHSVMEYAVNGIRVYDMNIAGGSYVNGQSAVVKDAKVGDQICFGDVCYTLDSFDASVLVNSDDIPPVLNSSESKGVVPPVVTSIAAKRINKNNNPAGKKGSYDKIEYPLETSPNADDLEYIFELPENIKNVLHYDLYEKSLEVTVTVGAHVLSIDYLDAGLSEFTLNGSEGKNGVTLPYLGKSEQVLFLEQRQGKYVVRRIDGFEFLNLSESKNNDILDNDSLAVFLSDQVKIFIRLSEAPPQTIEEPFIRNDKIFWKYFSIVIGAVLLFLVFVGVMDVNEELKEKKAPQKLASILYKTCALYCR